MTFANASLAFALLSAGVLEAQSHPHFVLTELAGNPKAQVLAVDPVLGTGPSIGGFASDGLAPLAIATDHIDGDLIVALDEANGLSRIVRLHRAGGTFTEFPVTTIAGRVVDLAVTGDSLVLAVDEVGGGLFSMPRRGGPVTQILQQANVTAMNLVGPTGVVVAWTGRAGTSQLDSGLGVLGLTTQQWWWNPTNWPNPSGRETTGVIDLPTAIPRQVLAYDDGTLELFSVFAPGQVLTPMPPIPAGGTNAMHPRGLYSTEPAVLGDANHPLLYAIDPWSASVLGLSLALPGSPVDFAHALDQQAHYWPYGALCGPQFLSQIQSGQAELGGVLAVEVTTQSAAFLPVLFVAGLTDYAAGVLPATLPGGCDLQVSPDFVTFELASAQGTAQKAITVPSSTSLVGTVVHTQWAHLGGAGFSVSNAIANWLGY